jgi:lipoprotein-anchoring transpeptidase ErfK/SrfK
MSHSRPKRTVIGAVAALAVAAGVIGLVASRAATAGPPGEGGRGHVAAAVASSPPPPAPRPAAPRPAVVARPRGPAPTMIATLRVATPYRQTPSGPVTGTLPANNPFGGAEVLAVVGGPAAPGWVRVDLPIRPNGSTGWIRTTGVVFTQTSFQVVVNVEADSVTVSDAGRVVLTTAAAVGKPSTPTPRGHTYLWELIRPDDPNGAYGPYIFGLGWYSDAYSVFNGGDAQIGIHGQDEPASVGHPVSHGCVRLDNDVITRLAGLLPLGTPVTIV